MHLQLFLPLSSYFQLFLQALEDRPIGIAIQIDDPCDGAHGPLDILIRI